MSAVGVLLRHHWRRHRLPLVPMMAGLALFHFLVTRIAPAPNEASWISQMLALVPSEMLALAGRDVGVASASGFLAIGYGHPFTLLLLSVWAVRVSSSVLAGEIGRGTMDLMAARPVPRWQFVMAGAVALAAGLVLLVGAAWTGTAIGLQLRDLQVPLGRVGAVAVSLWMLFFAWAAIGLVIGAAQREGGTAIAWTSGVIAASFVLEYLARLWTPMASLHPLSLFTYYDPQQVVRAGVHARDVLVLGSLSAAAFAAAVVVFSRRDL